MTHRSGGSQFYIGVTDPVSEDYRTYTGEEQYYFNWDVVYTPMADWTCVFINYDNFKWRETKCFFPKLALCSKTIQRGDPPKLKFSLSLSLSLSLSVTIALMTVFQFIISPPASQVS